MPNQRSAHMASIHTTIPRDLLDRSRSLADTRMVTLSAIVRQALAEFLAREERREAGDSR